MEADKRIRRLQASITLLWVLVAGWIAYPWAMDRMNAPLHRLRVSREGDTISLSPSSDGPFVVFALYVSPANEPEKRITTLSPPLVIVDSGGAKLSFRSLAWKNYKGEPADAPSDGEVRAIYTMPSMTELAG